jgi:phosphoribosyl 1,2-cyclic phosphate phosphodiesterase
VRIHIMGSSAAEGWPAVWCNCQHCHRARAAGGKNIRTRSGALVDGVIKLDLCADTYMQALRDGLDLSRVTDLLVTHAHSDHFVPSELHMHRPPFAHDNAPMHVWGGEQVIEQARKGAGNWHDVDARFHVLTPFEPVTLSDGTYVLPLKAAHDPNATPLNYIIRRNGKTLFYGLDSGWYPEESWAAHAGHVIDAVIIDCTSGDGKLWWGHGTLGEAIKIKEQMLAAGTAHDGTVFVANHFSHNCGLLHAEIEARLAPADIAAGYDGMVIEV